MAGSNDHRHQSAEQHRGVFLVRSQLIVMTVCWVAVGIANGYLAPYAPWTATVVAFLAAGAGICTGALAVIPSTEFAYRVGGTLGVGAIGFRILSLVLMAGHRLALDDVIISIAITVMFNILYWQWWLNVVGRWRRVSSWSAPPRKHSEPGDPTAGP